MPRIEHPLSKLFGNKRPSIGENILCPTCAGDSVRIVGTRTIPGGGKVSDVFELKLECTNGLHSFVIRFATADDLTFGFALTGVRVDYYEYINSAEWKERSREARERAGNRCQLCNTPESQMPLNTHHRTYEHLGYESPSDLIVLCRNCHAKFHDKLPT